METSIFNRLQLTLLGLVTAGLVLLAALNFIEERRSQQSDDRVRSCEAASGRALVADKVLPDSPGLRAGIRADDRLTGVSILPVGPVGSRLPGAIRPREPLASVKVLPEEASQRTGNEPLILAADVKFTPVVRSADLERALYRTGSYFQIYYRISRDGASPILQ